MNETRVRHLSQIIFPKDSIKKTFRRKRWDMKYGKLKWNLTNLVKRFDNDISFHEWWVTRQQIKIVKSKYGNFKWIEINIFFKKYLNRKQELHPVPLDEKKRNKQGEKINLKLFHCGRGNKATRFRIISQRDFYYIETWKMTHNDWPN